MVKKGLIIFIAICALILAYWLASPLFINTVVDESLPEVRMSIPSPTTVLPTSSSGTVVGETPVLSSTAAPQPETVFSGNFQDGDSFHKGSGSAKVYTMADGSKTLRFENFSVTNGPDLFVYVTDDSNVRDGLTSFTNIGALKGNKGNQNYPLPNDLTITDNTKVLIWCRAFGVLFAEAALKWQGRL